MKNDLLQFRQLSVKTWVPPHVFFLVSAVFPYLGPAFAVLLFAHTSVLGVAWLRIGSAALVFAIWRRPWRIIATQSRSQRRNLFGLGIVLGLMNACFYEAIARLPLSTVGAIEFIGPIVLAAIGARTRRNIAALVLAAFGGWVLTDVRLGGEPLGYLFAFANCALFMLYVVLGHRIAQNGGAAGIDRLGFAMLIAMVTVGPLGFTDALPAVGQPRLLLAGLGVGICSSVIPYVCDQLAMARLSRPTFALLLSLLPASATVIGILVLRQIPMVIEVVGILLVEAGVALHQERAALAKKESNLQTHESP
jgi:inner membrane transporter RhtA